MLYVVFTLVISQLLTAFTGYTIVDPILNKIGPRSISIEPINFPITYGDKQIIRTNVINDGLRTINDLSAEYYFECESDDFKRAELHSTTLKRDEQDFFEFEMELNTTCSLITQPQLIEFYSDKSGQCYIKTGEIISSICSYCKLHINVYEGFIEIGNLTYWYPFVENEITLSSKLTKENSCLSYEEALNKTELTLLPDYTIKISMADFSIGCIRGDIEKEWCQEHYPELYEVM